MFDDIHTIRISIPFPIESVNVYLIEGTPLSLIDTGLRDPATLDAVTQALSQIGRKPRDLERIFVTHGHIDHFGAAQTLSEICGAEVFVHAHDLDKVTHKFLEQYNEEPSMLALYLQEAGVPASFYPFLLKEFLTHVRTFSQPLSRLETVQDGEEVRCGDRTLQVQHVPGHCLGQVCLYDAEDGLLFSGDHVLPDITPNPVIELEARKRNGYSSLKTYLASLGKTDSLEARFVFPGHGRVFGPAAPRIHEILQHHEERKADVLRILDGRAYTKWQICRQLFSELDTREAFLGLSEVDGHLELLEEAGMVDHCASDGASVFHAS